MLFSSNWKFLKNRSHLLNISFRFMAASCTQQTQKLTPVVCGISNKTRKDPVVKKINTPEFKSIFTEELNTLEELFKKYNYELRIAGGAVRDILMGIKPKDLDFATTATPEQMKDMFATENIRMINTNGERHGTITPRINNKENFEVTTLRIDIRTDGRHAEVQFTTDWKLDANRRDLTINSMFLGFDGTLYDYFYGYDDLKERRVVFVGDASIRIQEDYLRILRYFRFYGRIAREAKQHDEPTLEAIRSNVDGLARISGERIWSEMQKIIIGNFAEELIMEMIDCGLAPYCGLPNKVNLEEFKRLNQTLKNFEKPHYPILIMISLLNTEDDAMKMHERLKLSAFERDLSFFITRNRDKVEVECKTLNDCQKMCLKPNTKKEFVEQLLKYANKKELYTEFKSWTIPKFPINGNLLKKRGCAAERTMGLIINELKLIWAESDFKLTAEELLDQHLPVVMESAQTVFKPNKKLKTKDL